ncbi:MAG TPA: hypothetical protein VIJ94_09995 [Caulobacteraceae bacterium]
MPMMRRPVLVALATMALLCGCEREHLPPIGAAPAERAPSITAATAAGPPAFVGRWAASKAACAARGWALTPTSLTSPSALSCQFFKAQRTSAGYTVYSTCTVGKASQPVRLVFTLTGSGAARSLTLTGGPFTEPVSLSRCSEAAQSASSMPASAAAPA